jgi:hypothetical protein
LLQDALAISQQLRITPNKVYRFASISVCLRLLAVLSTAFSIGAYLGAPRGYSQREGEDELGKNI